MCAIHVLCGTGWRCGRNGARRAVSRIRKEVLRRRGRAVSVHPHVSWHSTGRMVPARGGLGIRGDGAARRGRSCSISGGPLVGRGGVRGRLLGGGGQGEVGCGVMGGRSSGVHSLRLGAPPVDRLGRCVRCCMRDCGVPSSPRKFRPKAPQEIRLGNVDVPRNPEPAALGNKRLLVPTCQPGAVVRERTRLCRNVEPRGSSFRGGSRGGAKRVGIPREVA